MTRWEATPAERAAVLEKGGWPVTLTLVAVVLLLAALLGMAVDVLA